MNHSPMSLQMPKRGRKMVEPNVRGAWRQSMWFAAFILALIFFAMLPLGSAQSVWLGPDLILLSMILWVIRRPSRVPVWLIASLAVIADLALLRPPGLMAALTVMGSEFLRARAHFLSDAPFIVEWAAAAGVAIAIGLINLVALLIFAVPVPGAGLFLIAIMATAVCYPLVMIAMRALFGLTRNAYVDQTIIR